VKQPENNGAGLKGGLAPWLLRPVEMKRPPLPTSYCDSANARRGNGGRAHAGPSPPIAMGRRERTAAPVA